MKFYLALGAVQCLLSMPVFNLAACRDPDLAGRILGRLSPDFGKCFGSNSIFFSTPFTACGKCRESAIRTSMLFQSKCHLKHLSKSFQDKLQTYVNWSNRTNVNVACQTESVVEDGKVRYSYNCIQALAKADTDIVNAKAKAEVNNEKVRFSLPETERICNNCTRNLVKTFRGHGSDIPTMYSFIPSSPPDELLNDIAAVCGYPS